VAALISSVRWLFLILCFLPFAGALGQSRLVWQPVQQYFILKSTGNPPAPLAGTRRLNSFVAYTHLGTDFGFMGPAEAEIEWQRDEVCLDLSHQKETWAGMWHSLAGLAREAQKPLNFTAPWPSWMQGRYQPQIVAVRVDFSGHGRLKIELKADDQSSLWSEVLEVKNRPLEPVIFALDPQKLTKAKLLNWICEGGSKVCLDAIYLGVQVPDLSYEEQVVASCYAKLARCYDPQSGFVKDRAHLEDGAFESIASTGMFALATAAVAQSPLEMVSRAEAGRIVRQIANAVKALDRPRGLLPHFVRRCASGYGIHPGTEFSTVDTALYYHSLLLSAELLKDEALKEELLTAMQGIQFDQLRLPGGEVTHGMKEDGHTLLAHGWRDWGGETALVMMLQHLLDEKAPRVPMQHPGQAWQGTGFITEIQSLFYPDFSESIPSAVDGVNWLAARQTMLRRQRDAISLRWPGSKAAELGLYGFSAGEGDYGDRYLVGGVDLPNQVIIHPHYMLMSGALREPAELYQTLQRLEEANLFPPWGLVESVHMSVSHYLPMNGSLNAAFETLGAYHLFAKHRQLGDAVYEACRLSPQLRRAAELFYPKK
jgi:hypothetical protein